ncbi:hypothetical protein Fmac_019652 [Flemingia macrophylla]|uniref:F-box associated beta-propeller type 1 domain-containing protein n=1 Tax=Flemingia macrophylla TaxID=520843 RepID=A0ABD1M8K3_9FABA
MVFSHGELFEIFSWLPAKAVYKFMSVGEFFSRLPKETYFATKQAQKALLRDDTCFFLQPGITLWYRNQIELHSLPGEELSSGVFNDVIQFLSNKMFASSNGLILYRVICHNQVKLCVCNPVTQSFLSIPTLEHMQDNIYANLDVGFKCDANDFKLFNFYANDWNSYDCYVYESKKDVWKAMEERFFIGSRNMIFDMPVHYNGAIHFISDCFPYIKKNHPYFRPYIMSYSFEDGKSRMLRVPKEARRGSHDHSCDMRIFRWGKVANSNHSICLVRLRKRVFTVWTLTNYESSLWKRILKLRVKAMRLMEKEPIVQGFTVLNGDLLVFATEKMVYGYDLINKKIQKICEHRIDCNFLRFTSYSNTLRICGTDTETLSLSEM